MESVDLIKIYTKGKWLFAIFNSYNKKCYLNSNVRLVCWSKTKQKNCLFNERSMINWTQVKYHIEDHLSQL